MLAVVPIVEGTGDTNATRSLILRYLRGRSIATDAISAKGRGNITRKGGLERLLSLASTIKPPYEASRKAILVLLDADDEPCAGTFALNLAERAQKCRLPHPVAIVVANRMFESWVIGSFEEMVRYGVCTVCKTVTIPDDVESIHKPKQWLEVTMSEPPYVPEIHQESFSMFIDFNLVKQRCRSFRRFCKTLDELLTMTNPPRGHVLPSHKSIGESSLLAKVEELPVTEVQEAHIQSTDLSKQSESDNKIAERRDHTFKTRPLVRKQ